MRTWRAFLLLLSALVSLPAGAEPIGKRVPVRVEFYRITVELEPARHELAATTTITLRAAGERVQSIPFEIANTLKIDSIQDSRGRLFESTRVGPSYSHTHLLELPQPLEAGEAVDVAFRYHGTLAEKPLDYITAQGVLLRDESRWYPIIDLSSIAGLEMRVTVPAGLETVTSGDLIERNVADGRATFLWRTERPVSSRSLAAGRFEVALHHADGVDIYTYLAQGDASLASSLGERLGQILRFFGETIGTYPWKRYSVVEGFPRPPGTTGYSAPGFLVASPRALRSSGYLEYDPQFLPHEVAHQWFPGEVTMASESDAFIAESLAEYCAWVYLERILPARDSRNFLRMTHLAALTGDLLPLEAGLRLFGWYDWPSVYRTLYQRGMLVYRTLQTVMGDDAFLRLLREFYARYRGKMASVRDFQSLAEEIHGAPLGWFFNLYIKGTELPEMTFSLEQAAGAVEGRLRVANAPRDFLQPVELEFLPSSRVVLPPRGTVRALVFAHTGDNTFAIENARLGNKAVIDPDWKILFWREEAKRSRAVMRLVGRAAEASHKGEFAEAHKALREARAADPEDLSQQRLWVYFTQARVLFRARRHEASLAAMSRALRAESYDRAATALLHTWAHIFRGYSLEQLGQRHEALVEYRKALKGADPPILDTPFELEEFDRVTTAGQEIAARLRRASGRPPKKH